MAHSFFSFLQWGKGCQGLLTPQSRVELTFPKSGVQALSRNMLLFYERWEILGLDHKLFTSSSWVGFILIVGAGAWCWVLESLGINYRQGCWDHVNVKGSNIVLSRWVKPLGLMWEYGWIPRFHGPLALLANTQQCSGELCSLGIKPRSPAYKANFQPVELSAYTSFFLDVSDRKI